jgi:hypothetical protein
MLEILCRAWKACRYVLGKKRRIICKLKSESCERLVDREKED